MEQENNLKEIASELKNANEEEITEVIKKWFEQTRTDGMKLGAKFISAGVFGAMQKHINKPNPSLRDYERCIKDLRKIIAVQLPKKDETKENKQQEEEV